MSGSDADRRRSGRSTSLAGGAGGIGFLGLIGALSYYLHAHSGTFWLVLVAFMKAVVWPAFVGYHVLSPH